MNHTLISLGLLGVFKTMALIITGIEPEFTIQIAKYTIAVQA
jgi:hypothetical protein